MYVITISRELGSFGTQIAEETAARLSSVCVDKEVLAEMSSRAGIPVELIVEAEERITSRPVVVTEEMRSLMRTQARQQGKGALMDENAFITAMREAIHALAAQGNVVFVGRGAQIVLADEPQALHVHIYAPLEVRAARIQQRRGLADLESALRLVRQVDERRANWYRRFFTGVNWKDARYYHLMINTARIPEETAVEMIVKAAASTAVGNA
jgi:cytidylate kinase